MENKQLWFKRKRYGWGWIPASIEGWLVLVVYFGELIYIFKSVDATQYSSSDTLMNLVPKFIVLTFVLIVICYIKGEKPKWTWGKDETESK